MGKKAFCGTIFSFIMILTMAILLPISGGKTPDSARAATSNGLLKKVTGVNDGQEYYIAVENATGKYTYLSYNSEYALTADSSGDEKQAQTWKAGVRGGEFKLESNDYVLSCSAPTGDGLAAATPTLDLAKRNSGSLSAPPEGPSGEAPTSPPPARGWKYTYSAGSGILSYTEEGTTYYISTDSSGNFSCTTDAAGAAKIVLLTKGDGTGDLITVQPESSNYYMIGDESYKAPSFSVTADIPSGITANYTWYLDDVDVCYERNFTLSFYKLPGVGVHEIYCTVSYTDPYGAYISENSQKTVFIACTGIIPNSYLTFSDVHEVFQNVGGAIDEIMSENDGCIPALIVCTGDWANTHPYVDEETTSSKYIPALKAQMGGIDAVFVSGNHENDISAVNANIAAALGYDGSGLIYDSESTAAGKNAKSSSVNEKLKVFGINFNEILFTDADGKSYYSYSEVYKRLEAFFEKIKNNYKDELIVISAHAGLHVLGVQPESNTDEWAGNAAYNIDGAYDMVSLINKYADEYNMDIVFLFGHDHSKKETEFMLKYGDEITSTKTYADKSYGTQKLSFTYAHAGYLTNAINGTEHYTFMTWAGQTISREFAKIAGERTTTKLYRISVKKEQKNQSIKITPATKKISFKKLKKSKQTYSLKSTAKTKATYKLVTKTANFKVSSSGKVTVKKGLKKKTYKIKVSVTAPENEKYKAATKTQVIKIKVA